MKLEQLCKATSLNLEEVLILTAVIGCFYLTCKILLWFFVGFVFVYFEAEMSVEGIGILISLMTPG